MYPRMSLESEKTNAHTSSHLTTLFNTQPTLFFVFSLPYPTLYQNIKLLFSVFTGILYFELYFSLQPTFTPHIT